MTVTPEPSATNSVPKAWGWIVGLAALALVIPTCVDLYRQVWTTDEQGHGPIIGAVSLWLIWKQREALLEGPAEPSVLSGSVLFAFALAIYALGRSQAILQFEAASLILLVAALILLLRGVKALRSVVFPLCFLIFMVPFPGVLVQAITVPLKGAVSFVAEIILYHLGYPIARTGVVLSIGQYQLMVADACAGLNSMFTLEALGLLYMKLMGYTSKVRNLLLVILIIPISFAANVVRVLILVLVTYYFGDAAGQGFVHGFAGMVLFIVALSLMLITDGVVGRVAGNKQRATA